MLIFLVSVQNTFQKSVHQLKNAALGLTEKILFPTTVDAALQDHG